MKKISLILSLIFVSSLVFTSCEDEEKNPWDIHEDPANYGVFVTLAKKTQVIDFTDPNSTYSFGLDTPGNNVQSYELRVSRFDAGAGVSSDTVSLMTVTSFPADIDITSGDVADALGISVDDLAAGDRLDFIASAIGTNGETADIDNLNGDAIGPGQFNAFIHSTFLSCPFNQADAIGTYAVQTDAFGLASPTFEVIAGPDANSITIVDLIEPGYTLTLEVDPNTGIAAAARQPVASQFYGYSGGNINTTATASFVFSCVGTISATFQYTVDLGSFGSYAFVAVKQQ